MKRKSVEAYSSISKWLHWIIAILVLIMLSVGFSLDYIPKAYKGMFLFVHKSTGITILFLMLIRIFCIAHFGKPALPFYVPMWERVVSAIVHFWLYILLLAMPLFGWIGSIAAGFTPTFFGLFNMPFYSITTNPDLAYYMFKLHKFTAWTLLVLVTVHILAALKHYFINKDHVLNRMLFESRNRDRN